MTLTAELDTAPDTIEATLNYIVDDGKPVFTIVAAPGGSDTRSGATPDPRRVTIHNGRPQAQSFVLDRNGFRFVRHDTKVADFYDEAEIKRVYYAEMVELVKAESGAKRVVVFDHTLRTADDALRESKQIREVVRRVHNDYTEWSAPQRVRDILPDEAEELLKRRFAIIQVWRPIRFPVETFPLAMADARTLSPSDMIVSERRAPGRIRPDLRDQIQSGASVVLVSAHAARGGLCLQGLRFGKGRPRPLDRAYRIRRSNLAAARAATREHRNPDDGVFLRNRNPSP
jgi:hypothetical protein